MTQMKPKLATVWLDGCSGCHMSLLDIDERIIDLVNAVDIVHSPVVDPKTFPDDVLATLVEGAVSSEHDYELAHLIRRRSKLVIALGDCAVTGNVPAMRNPFKIDQLLQRAYVENATANQGVPTVGIPPLRKTARPLHEIIKVDLFIPGCPPPADAIHHILTELLAGRTPDTGTVTRFGL
ncbi:MAG: hypothetical protein WC058_08615 [Phycisphaeraceae bacterium]